MIRRVVGIGETVLDIIFKDDQPIGAVPGGSVYNSLISLGRSGILSPFHGTTRQPMTTCSKTGHHIVFTGERSGNIVCQRISRFQITHFVGFSK